MVNDSELPTILKSRPGRVFFRVAGFLIGLLIATFVVFQVFFLWTTIWSAGLW